MTIHNSGSKSRKDRDKGKEGFICNVKYTNTLPDVPFDAKFIAYPFEPNRFIEYKPTSLERNYKHELLTEPDLGVTIDLINPETYDVDMNVELDPADEHLLEEEHAPQSDQKRHRQHTKTVSWLRKTEYISTEYNRFQTSNEMAETKVGYSIKKKEKGGGVDLYKDRDSQLEAIEASFDAAKKPITKHYTNPRLKPVEVLPFFPDFQFWHMPCAHVIFDTEPTSRGKTSPATREEMSLGMIRGMEDESGDQFVAYFLPTKDTLTKKKKERLSESGDVNEDEEYEYKLAREYNWNVKNKAIKGFEENYFFVFREGEGVFYNELQTRVRLNKRRGRGGAGGVSSSVSKLIVKTRDPTENEIRLQNARLVQLENVVQEDDDEDDDDESDPEQSADNNEQTETKKSDTDNPEEEGDGGGDDDSQADKKDSDSDDLFGSSSDDD